MKAAFEKGVRHDYGILRNAPSYMYWNASLIYLLAIEPMDVADAR